MPRLYVGNLNFATTEPALSDLFAQYGPVNTVSIIIDRETGRSRGFGFVELADGDAAEKAIADLNGQDLDGRRLVVNEARPREARPSGFGSDGPPTPSPRPRAQTPNTTPNIGKPDRDDW